MNLTSEPRQIGYRGPATNLTGTGICEGLRALLQFQMRGLYIIRRKYTDEWRRRCDLFHRRPTASFETLNQTSDAHDVEAEFARRFNGLDRRSAGGTDVIHDHHAGAFFLKALYAATHAMGLLCFAHKKTMNRRPSL